MKTCFVNIKLSAFAIVFMLMFILHEKSYCQDKQNPSQIPVEKSQALTPQQTATIKTILSKYNASKLTAADAKAIHDKFREAGIHGGPETKNAITAAGFDPEKLKALAPPKSPDNSGKANPPSNEERLKTVQEKIIKPLSLNTTQSQTVNQAYKDFYTAVDNLRKARKDPQERLDKSKIQPLVKARDDKINKVLTKEQFAKYLEVEKSLRPGRPNDEGSKKNQTGK